MRRNEKGEWLVSDNFRTAYPFVEGCAAVSVRGKWGYINKDFKYVIPPFIDETKGFPGGMRWLSWETG